MNKMTFPGEPVPQGRPRFSGRGEKAVAIDPPESRNAKAFIRMTASSKRKKKNIEKIAAGHPVAYRIEFVHKLPKSWSKAKKERFSGALKTSKPDQDNLLKLPLDAFKGVLWDDDSQVAVCYGIVKRYANYDRETDKQEEARTIFEWEELPLNTGG